MSSDAYLAWLMTVGFFGLIVLIIATVQSGNVVLALAIALGAAIIGFISYWIHRVFSS